MIASFLLATVITLSPFSNIQPVSEASAIPPKKVMPVLLRKHSDETARGYEKSSYQGRWYDKRWESVRKCIGTRESHFQYMMGSGPNIGGAYQFMASDHWPVSLAWMMKKETRKNYGKAEANRMWRVLSSHEVNQWARFWQDQAFWVVWRHGAGKHHWDPVVPGTGCF